MSEEMCCPHCQGRVFTWTVKMVVGGEIDRTDEGRYQHVAQENRDVIGRTESDPLLACKGCGEELRRDELAAVEVAQ